MTSPYIEVIDKPTGKVTIDPNTGIPTHCVPALGLTTAGQWVPLLLNPDGSVVMDTPPTGDSHYDDSLNTVTPGLQQTLIDQIVPANTIRLLSQVIVSTRVTGVFWITLDGAIIGSGRTGPGGYPFIPYIPSRAMQPGQEYKVFFTSRLNAPVQSVECYVQASDVAQ